MDLGPFYSGGLVDLGLFNSKVVSMIISTKKITNIFDKWPNLICFLFHLGAG